MKGGKDVVVGVAVPVIAHGAALAHLLYCVHANAAPPVLYRSGQHAHLHRVDGFAHVAAAAQGNGFHDAVFQLQRRLLFLLQNGKSRRTAASISAASTGLNSKTVERLKIAL